MNTFKRKSLHAALAGLSALGVAGAAQAVYVNPDGLGQVLLYPYYTVRSVAGNNYNTLLSVVNSTASVKAVKVRFLEGKNSKEVLDFNLYLSAYDVWTASLVETTNGAKIVTQDHSCTVPPIPAAGQEFVNYAYIGGSADGADTSLDRTREGYFEMIEMGVLINGSTSATQYADFATHGAPSGPGEGGVPEDCGAIVDADFATALEPYVLTPTGGLFGHESLVNVNVGTDYTADPTALDAFYVRSNIQDDLWTHSGSVLPTLENVYPTTAVSFNAANLYYSSFPAPAPWPDVLADSVSTVLMHRAVLNEYVLDPDAKAGTDWVITFPTKRFYYPTSIISSTTGAIVGKAPRKLFQRNFGANGACDDIEMRLWDREEHEEIIRGFSPPPPGGFSLCWESSVVTYANSNVLGSKNVANVAVPSNGTPNGWVRLGFATATANAFYPPFGITTAHLLVAGLTQVVSAGGTSSWYSAASYYGLPTIGFAVHAYRYDALNLPSGTVLANYGGNPVHKNQRVIVPTGQGTPPPTAN